MDLRSLELFVAVARRGSFAAVARDRRIDPSSVSRTIATLEESLDLRLFQRTTRRLSLTEAGSIYLTRIEALLEELQDAQAAATDATRSPKGTLRLLVPVSIGLLNVVPLLPAFSSEHPDLHVDLRLTDALLDPVEEQIDLAIRLGPLADSNLVARELAPMVPRVCASPSYLSTRGRPARVQDLANHPCLQLDMPGFGNRWRFRDARGRESEVDVTGPLVTSNAMALKSAAIAGMGIILQARWIVGRELRNGSLVDLFPEHTCTAAHFDNAAWLLTPSRAYVPEKVRAMSEFLLHAFRDGLSPWERDSAS